MFGCNEQLYCHIPILLMCSIFTAGKKDIEKLTAQKKDFQEALRMGCYVDQPDGEVCTGLGLLYDPKQSMFRDSQVSFPINQKKANELYKRGCDLGHDKGCQRLAAYYIKEEKDITKAMHFIERGCELGSAASCKFAALAYAGKSKDVVLPVDEAKHNYYLQRLQKVAKFRFGES